MIFLGAQLAQLRERPHNGEVFDVGAIEEFQQHSVRIVDVAGREIGIVRWDDELFAVHNRCPHMAGPLCMGSLGPKLVCQGLPGDVDLDDRVPVIACAWHRWEFDARTGESLWDPGYRAKTFPVTLKAGRVLVDLGRR
jgi:3-phenylpropionate/trans-cinnamate dioxygenase ferredoxin subunit